MALSPCPEYLGRKYNSELNIFDDRGATITFSGLEEENWRTPEEMTTTPRFGESSRALRLHANRPLKKP